MDHSKFQLMIQQHIDNVLSPAEEEQLRQHLDVCPDCAALMRDLSSLDELLAAELTEVDPPAGFAERVMDALPAEGSKKPRRRLYLIWGSVAAAALLLVAAISGLFHQNETLAPPPPIAVDDEEDAARPELTLPNAPIVAENETGDKTDEAVNNNENSEDKDDTAAPAQDEQSAQSNGAAPVQSQPEEAAPTYSGEHELPSVASGSYAPGAFSTVTLASVANCDALRPQINGSVVTFYINLDGSYLQWQVSADGSGNAVFLGECSGLPSLPGAGQYHCDENGREWYSASTASGSYVAENSWSGLTVNGQEVSTSGGGYLVSWAGDGSKVFFTDGGGTLRLYYPAEGMLLDVASSVSSAVWYGSNSIVMSAYDGSTGYYSIFRVSVP